MVKMLIRCKLFKAHEASHESAKGRPWVFRWPEEPMETTSSSASLCSMYSLLLFAAQELGASWSLAERKCMKFTAFTIRCGLDVSHVRCPETFWVLNIKPQRHGRDPELLGSAHCRPGSWAEAGAIHSQSQDLDFQNRVRKNEKNTNPMIHIVFSFNRAWL